MLFRDDATARAQHNAVRDNVGWYRWTHDLLEVSGSDAMIFLDYIYANSIMKTKIGKSKYTTMLDENGGIIDDVIVMHMKEDYFWISTLYLPELVEWIESKKGNYNIEYRDITSEKDMYAVQGPNSRKLLNKITKSTVDELKYFSIMSNSVGGALVTIHRSGFTGELGFEIFCDKEDSDTVNKALQVAGSELDAVNLDVLEVYVRGLPGEKGYVLRQDLLGLTPFEADMGWAVDMSKDFIGKAALVKNKEGGPRRQLAGIEFDTSSYNDIDQCDSIKINGINVGYVTAAMYGYTIDKNIGYAVVDRKKAPVGSKVLVGSNNVPARIVNRSWYDTENKRPRV